MKKYEVMYIIKPDLDADSTSKVIANVNEIFSKNDGKVVSCDEIGLKDLAYEIDHFNKGFYVKLIVEAGTQAVSEFNRIIRITETVIRYVIISVEE